MSTEKDLEIDNSLLHELLRDFAKEYRKQFKNTPCELIIVGGSSVLINYGFRQSTRDIDYFSIPQRSLKDVIYAVAYKRDLDVSWMNDDFRFSPSYTPKLSEVSSYYTDYNNGSIVIRTIKSKYLIAMKMMADREFGDDVSDIIGIIRAEKENGNTVLYSDIVAAGKMLYGKKFNISESLLKRVQAYCDMSVIELNAIYDENVQKSKDIKDEIEIIINQENVSINRVTATELGKEIEKRKTQILKDKIGNSEENNELEEPEQDEKDIDI